MIPEIVRLNGYAYSWASVIFKINFIPYKGIRGVDFGDSMEEELVYGADRSGGPVARTYGKYNPGDLSVTCLRGTAQTIMESLGIIGLGAISTPQVTCSLTLTEPGQPDTVYMFEQCRLLAPKEGQTEGTAGLESELTFKPMHITRNGLSLKDRILRAIPF